MFKFNNIHLDDETMWPTDARIDLEKPYVDERGEIQHLVNFPMKNLSMIFSKKGAVRSNHSHFTDWHYMYTVYGEYEIAEDTKIINHSAAIAGGSSGGPLFDKNGYLIGINTFGDEKFNFSISCDHIQDLLKN